MPDLDFELTTGVRWCDPPVRTPKTRWTTPVDRRVWAPRLEPLMAQPGRWALVHDYSYHRQAVDAVRDLRRGRMVLPPGQWEFKQARIPDIEREMYGVWARAVCQQEPAAEET